MSQEKQQQPNLRKLDYSPNFNPLLCPQEITIKRKRKVVATSGNFVDTKSGESYESAGILSYEDVDQAHFVKVYPPLIAATYALSKTAMRVFQEILISYQKMKMSGGFIEDVRLFWFDGGLDGRALGMSEKTFQRGLKELLANGFLSPRSPDIFWVNPALFFRGDRVRFIKEYRIKKDTLEHAPRTVDLMEV